MILKPVLIFCIFMITLSPTPVMTPEAVFAVKTDEGYTMEIGVAHTVDESQPNMIVLSVKICNVSAPYILTCRIFVDESIEKKGIIPIDTSEISSQMEEGMQVLTGTITLFFPEGKKLLEVPLFVSGLYSGCEGGCESFLIGPLEYRLSEEPSSPITIVQGILLFILGCGLLVTIVYHMKKK